jgi:DNA-binding PadR family transcriptional regulator
MYELFILGELMDYPMHGYLVHTTLKNVLGPAYQISWGALYPLLRRLERDGLIATGTDDGGTDATAGTEGADDAGGGRGRPRKLYHITPAGRERFAALMVEPDEYTAAYPDLVRVKMINFDRVTRVQQLAILSHYRTFVQLAHDHAGANQRRVRANLSIPKAERENIVRMQEYRRHMTAADLAWIDAEIVRIEGEDGQGAVAAAAAPAHDA